MEIKPIHNEADYQQALEEINRLLDASPGTPDGDRLEVLITLVDAYEEATDPIPLPDPIEAILHSMENQDISFDKLESFIGDREQVNAVLERRIPLSLEMIRNLRDGLGIPAEVLIQSYELEIIQV